MEWSWQTTKVLCPETVPQTPPPSPSRILSSHVPESPILFSASPSPPPSPSLLHPIRTSTPYRDLTQAQPLETPYPYLEDIAEQRFKSKSLRAELISPETSGMWAFSRDNHLADSDTEFHSDPEDNKKTNEESWYEPWKENLPVSRNTKPFVSVTTEKENVSPSKRKRTFRRNVYDVDTDSGEEVEEIKYVAPWKKCTSETRFPWLLKRSLPSGQPRNDDVPPASKRPRATPGSFPGKKPASKSLLRF